MDKYLLETFITGLLVSVSESVIHSIKIENECCLLVITNIASCTPQEEIGEYRGLVKRSLHYLHNFLIEQ